MDVTNFVSVSMTEFLDKLFHVLSSDFALHLSLDLPLGALFVTL